VGELYAGKEDILHPGTGKIRREERLEWKKGAEASGTTLRNQQTGAAKMKSIRKGGPEKKIGLIWFDIA
jgi:hypothetical protein